MIARDFELRIGVRGGEYLLFNSKRESESALAAIGNTSCNQLSRLCRKAHPEVLLNHLRSIRHLGDTTCNFFTPSAVTLVFWTVRFTKFVIPVRCTSNPLKMSFPRPVFRRR